MAIQDIALGTAPTGAGGDTFRSAATKINENFSNNAHAASRLVGVGALNVMQVGAFGVGANAAFGLPIESVISSAPNSLTEIVAGITSDFFYTSTQGTTQGFPEPYGSIHGYVNYSNNYSYSWQIFCGVNGAKQYIRSASSGTAWGAFYPIYTGLNTTTDSNGFIKKASPIIKLFADSIEANEEATEQNPVFEKVGTGCYLIRNTEGFSDNGWYIEMPKDANGNVLVAVVYEQLMDNTIEIKTYAKKFDEETGDIIANPEKPRDIPGSRWIDLRLKEIIKEVVRDSEQ